MYDRTVVAMNPSTSYGGDGFMATNTHPRLPLHLSFVAEVEREAGMRNTLVCVSLLRSGELLSMLHTDMGFTVCTELWAVN